MCTYVLCCRCWVHDTWSSLAGASPVRLWRLRSLGWSATTKISRQALVVSCVVIVLCPRLLSSRYCHVPWVVVIPLCYVSRCYRRHTVPCAPFLWYHHAMCSVLFSMYHFVVKSYAPVLSFRHAMCRCRHSTLQCAPVLLSSHLVIFPGVVVLGPCLLIHLVLCPVIVVSPCNVPPMLLSSHCAMCLGIVIMLCGVLWCCCHAILYAPTVVIVLLCHVPCFFKCAWCYCHCAMPCAPVSLSSRHAECRSDQVLPVVVLS